MLTAEQLEIRRTGIGASEVPAILGLSMPGGRSATDVWATKRRGPDGEIEPLVIEHDAAPDKCDAFRPIVKGDPRVAGSILEEGIAQLYAFMSGDPELREVATLTHPDHPWAKATPDRAVARQATLPMIRTLDEWHASAEHGLEIKLVGAGAARHYWSDEGIPDYVRTQCLWCMFITGAERWDVCALVGGSEPRVAIVEREDDVIEALAALVGEFWRDYVIGDRAPPAADGAAAMRILKAKWSQDNGEIIPAPDAAADMAVELLKAQLARDDAQRRYEVAQAAMAAMCGENKGIAGRWGKFYFGSVRGRPRWKDIALDLAGGVLADSLVDENRSQPGRTPKFYPAKWLKQDIAAAAVTPQEGADK